MSKELVISEASHERRVAILEEGQLVEIYIEREKEFALVGSIYKGRVTRVLPGMQSAFVDIGLDGDAFLYVSDVFENLEDYDHDHGHSHGPQVSVIPPAAALVEALPGESLANAHSSDEAAPLSADDAAQQAIPHEEPMHADFTHEHEHNGSAAMEAQGETEADENRAAHSEPEERQPESNASAPENFGQYNPTQKCSRPGGSDRNDRGGQDFRGDRGGDRGRGGRWGRRGGRRRGGRPQGGRNLPPSKYASPQSPQGEQRPHDPRGSYDSRGQQGRSFEPRDQRRPEGSRFSPPAAPPSSGEDDIVLPGESLAKYRNKPAAASADTLVGGATFEETEEEEEEEEEGTHAEDQAEEHEEIHASEAEAESQDVGAEEIQDIETRALDSHALREAEADAAHESALHAAAIGEPEIHEETGRERIEATGSESAPASASIEDDAILLPGETRAPRSGAPEPRQDFPRDSARIGGNPRAPFQPPYRRGRQHHDNRRPGNPGRDTPGGGRPDKSRGGRPRGRAP